MHIIQHTAARIEGLSKHLGTWLLASDAVVAGLGDIATRELGCFKPAGKSMPTIIHEVRACGDGAQHASMHNGAAFDQAQGLSRPQLARRAQRL